MEEYHKVWLEAHPERTEEWLQARLKDGFNIHHMDGDHSNNIPANLVLIDGEDHLRLHGLPAGHWTIFRRGGFRKPKTAKEPKPERVKLPPFVRKKKRRIKRISWIETPVGLTSRITYYPDES